MDRSPVDRIDIALETLRNDLIELRHIDIMLLRQLLKIHATIQELMKRTTMARTQSCINYLSSNKLQRFQSFKDDRSIIRQQSTPSFCNLSSSCTSLEDSLPSSNCMFYLDESDDDLYKVEPPLNSNTVNNRFYLPETEDTADVQKFEEILQTNIREWKSSNSIEITNSHYSCVCKSF